MEAEAAACLARLGLAERLVGGLSSENERWGNEIRKLQVTLNFPMPFSSLCPFFAAIEKRVEISVGDPCGGACGREKFGPIIVSCVYMIWVLTFSVCVQENALTLTGDCMLAAGFVSYVGAFDQDNRGELWRNVWTPDIVQVRRKPHTICEDDLE